MSAQGDKLTREQAGRVIRELRERLGHLDADHGGLGAVGSYRRGARIIGDLDMVAPFPVPFREDLLSASARGKIGGLDRLYIALANRTRFDAAEKDPEGKLIFGELSGLKPGFLTCRLWLYTRRMGLDFDKKVQVSFARFWRVDEAAPSNRGWTIVRTTGPAEFGRALLGRIKKHQGWSEGHLASADGFLVNGPAHASHRPARISTPDEASVFKLAGLVEIPPTERDTALQRKD